MKKFWLLLPAFFVINSCIGQNNLGLLRPFSYYTNGSNKRVAEISLTGDSLFFIDKTPYGDRKEESYPIAGQQKKGKYFFIYVKRTLPSWKKQGTLGAFVFYFSKNKEQLSELSENTSWYASMEEAEKANAEMQFEDKYFYTWYSDRVFKAYMQYPDIQTADRATIQKITDTWTDESEKNADRIRSTPTSDPYGAGHGKDALTKILIDNHISPLATFTDLSKKTTEYHIRITSQFIYRRYPVPMRSRPDTAHSKLTTIRPLKGMYSSADVIIDEPPKVTAKDTTICDSVYSTQYFSGSPMTHLALGGDYPHAKYTIMIGGRSRNKFKEAPETAYKNKRICVTGKVISTNVIMVSDPAQITLHQ